MEKSINKIERKDILDYEIRANRFAKNINNKILQRIFGVWMARKVRKKYSRYIISLNEKQEVNRNKQNEYESCELLKTIDLSNIKTAGEVLDVDGLTPEQYIFCKKNDLFLHYQGLPPMVYIDEAHFKEFYSL